MNIVLYETNKHDEVAYIASFRAVDGQVFIPKKERLYDETTLFTQVEDALFRKVWTPLLVFVALIWEPKLYLSFSDFNGLSNKDIQYFVRNLVQYEYMNDKDDENATSEVQRKYGYIRYRTSSLHIPSLRFIPKIVYLHKPNN
jgi:hypothetical protein